jgi:D-alanyl-lipoteichoic acid acyltransferase DltB (MBOAT superfamily)
MLFNSYIYIFFFLPAVFVIYFYLNKKRLTTASKGFLFVASMVFYCWWKLEYLPLILGSILCNFILGISLAKPSEHGKISRKSLLILGIAANISLLGFYKYTDFVIGNVNLAFSQEIPLLDLTLPLAISFFTFQQIAYLVDSYRGETEDHDFLHYAVFVTFFPQLIAGPIVHHKEMMPQFDNIRNKVINTNNISKGLFIFSAGLFKKVMIADTFAVWAINGFDEAVTLNFIDAWITSLSYSLQLYYDFSGYTDMAIGAALFFNIKIPINFNSPYRALDIQDFWQRWHITLSRFLRDYVYIPLGGNHLGHFRTYTNLMATFLLGGLWHGAGWTFIFWGFLHGLAIVIHRIWRSFGFSCNKVVAWFITFNFVNIAWVFFRAKSWPDAIKVLRGMFGFEDIILPQIFAEKLVELTSVKMSFSNDFISLSTINDQFSSALTCVVILVLIIKWMFNQYSFKGTVIDSIANSFMFIVAIFFLVRESEFLYFGF